MQSMIPINRNGKPMRAFFDVNWECKQIENVSVFDGEERVSITPKDLISLRGMIEAEVSAIVIEAAKEMAYGTLMEA